jgi:hypothetical protein
MSEATQTAKTADAREASKSRVTTQDTLLASLKPPEAAKEPPEVKEPVKTEAEAKDETKKPEEPKPKKTAQERIQEVISQHKKAEAEKLAEKRRADELELQLIALRAHAKPMETAAKPLRSQFATDDEYIEALTDHKAREALAKREQEQAQARAEAEQAEVAAKWSKRQTEVMKALPDYAEVLGKSEMVIPEHIHQAILESEQGPQIAYYLALHPDEAKRIGEMKQIAGIKRITALERDLAAIDAEDEAEVPPKKEADPPKEEKPQVQKSKAPPPIDHVKSVPSATGSSTNDYEEYRRRRKAEIRAKNS